MPCALIESEAFISIPPSTLTTELFRMGVQDGPKIKAFARQIEQEASDAVRRHGARLFFSFTFFRHFNRRKLEWFPYLVVGFLH